MPQMACSDPADQPRHDVATIGERLEHARRRRFVGRRCEMHLFGEALAAPTLPFSILYLHGPGGVGKTTLLKRFAAAATAAGVPVGSVDLRHVGPSAADLRVSFRSTMGLAENEPFTAAIASYPRFVLMVDTYEAVASADDWVREELVPSLPAGVLVVLAGRKPPSLGWRVDPGWSDLVRIVALGNLGEGDCREFLAAAGVPEQLRQDGVDISHGHPLALSLLADVIEQQGAAGTVGLVHDRDLVRILLERFTSGIPGTTHRRALEACAFTRALTEPVLRIALDVDDAGELFSWLRTMSIVEESPRGLVVHDLAREVLEADMAWRDAAEFRRMRRRLMRHLWTELLRTSGRHQQHLLFDLKFLHRTRDHAEHQDWDSIDQVGVEPLRPEDHHAVVEMTTRHEGPESAHWVRFWLDRQPQAFDGFRGHDRLLGFSCNLELNQDPAGREADPATRGVWAHVARDPELGPADRIMITRFIMDAEVYQRPSRAFDHRVTIKGKTFFGNPQLAWDFTVVRDPYLMADEMAYFDYTRLPEGDFVLGGHRYIVFARDWRRRPLATWGRMMAQRALAAPGSKPSQAPLREEVELSRPEFDAAVKEALRHLTRPTLLVDNELLATRLAGRQNGAMQAAARVTARVRAAAMTLSSDPRDGKLFRALERTYLRPAPSQERAAEALGLPFSTYRRHLAHGISRVAASLWLEAYPAEPTHPRSNLSPNIGPPGVTDQLRRGGQEHVGR